VRDPAYSALFHLSCPKGAQNSGGSYRASKSSELTAHGARTDQHPTAADINSDLTHVWTVKLRKCRVSTDNALITYAARRTRGNRIFLNKDLRRQCVIRSWTYRAQKSQVQGVNL